MKIIKKICRKIFYFFENAKNELENEELLGKIGRIGRDTKIERPCNIHQAGQIYLGDSVLIRGEASIQCINYKSKPSIIVGDNTGFGKNITIIAANDIIFGENVSVARNVYISNANHQMDAESEDSFGDQRVEGGVITIGDGAWLGEKACILGKKSGLSIGKKSIVGAGSVVTQSVPDYTMVAGNPAKIIKVWDFETKQWKRIQP